MIASNGQLAMSGTAADMATFVSRILFSTTMSKNIY